MWNDNEWSALDSGLNNIVCSIVVDTSDNIFVGGWFTKAGGLDANYIAKCRLINSVP
jgi:hypothetical protein